MRQGPVRDVPPQDWLTCAAVLREEGFTFLDMLAGVDRQEEREVIVHLVDTVAGRRVMLSTRVPAASPRLPSLVPVFPAAAWHEREAAEMLGLEFVGHPDPRPLLLREPVTEPPLLVSVPLAQRLATPWPAARPETAANGRVRRAPQVPGVRPAWRADGSGP